MWGKVNQENFGKVKNQYKTADQKAEILNVDDLYEHFKLLNKMNKIQLMIRATTKTQL